MLTRRFLTVKEVADLVQVSEASVRHWIKLQQLRAIDLGREWRVIPRDLEAFLARLATSGAASLPVDPGGGASLVRGKDGDAPSEPLDHRSQPRAARGSHSSDAAARGANRGKEKEA